MMLFQQHQQIVDENMSNLTSASGEASVSSGNRTEIGTNYSHQCFAPPNQTQPPAKKKRNLPGNPDPDAEVIALSPKTLMATNRFICEICNKGFQRDQNLQLHRRGHNLPWKLKQRTSKEVKKKVYVCPEAGCVHHDPSRALGDLTGIKKHFCRKHGEKKWKCDKCSKRYAVQSDWKAHSKTCGTREYRCDCGTLFSRRDSFITHRAFCDALAEESARTITGNNPLLGSSSNINLQPQPQPHQFNSQTLHPFSLKKEQHQSFRQELPPWLNCQAQPNPSQIDLSSSSSIFSTRLDQDFPPTHQDLAGLHDNSTTTTTPTNPNPSLGPTLPSYQPAVPSPHMSATALLQKAAQMGATMSSNKQTGSSSMAMTRPHHQAHVSAQENNNNFGLNLSSHEVEDHNNLMASFGNSSSSATMAGATTSTSNSTTTAGVVVAPSSSSSSLLHHMINSSGFEGTSFEDAFGGIFNSKKVNIGRNLHDTLSRTTAGGKADDGGGGGEGLTRDFLGLRALSHSDILNIAGLGNTMNISREHQNQSQKPW